MSNKPQFVGECKRVKIPLQSLGAILTGNTPSKKNVEFWDASDIPFVKPGDIDDVDVKAINGGSEFLSNKARAKARIAKPGSILVTCIGTIAKIAIVEEREVAFNQQINCIEVDESVIDPFYLAYALQANRQRLRILANAPVVPIINKTQFESFCLFVDLNTEHQRKVVAELNAINKQQDSLRLIVGKLDSLVKSRFVEMFETGRYAQRLLGELVEEMHIGPFGSAMKNDVFVSEGDASCVVYEQKHAISRSIGLPWRYVDAIKRAELKRFEAGPGTILVSCRGTLGKVYQLPKDAPVGVIHPSLMKIEIDKSQLDGVYFTYLLETIFARAETQAKGSGVKMAIKAKELAATEIEYPPLGLQQEFAAFVSQVDKSRFVAQQQIEKLQMLYDSLAQDYFG